MKPQWMNLIAKYRGAATVSPALPEDASTEIKRAHQLIAAIDAGGIPLDPRKIRQIANTLGLEVSPKARMEETIERIRAALARL